MRSLRYNCAASLDGFIATPDGGYDWIVQDDAIDFGALYAEFDLFVMGRKTYEVVRAMGDGNPLLGRKVIVASRTLKASDRPDVEIVCDNLADRVAEWKAQPGKDIWLYGGGELARTLFDARLVDTIEVALIPVLLGDGIPLVAGAGRVPLKHESTESLPSGIQMLKYRVQYDAA